jgi:hypothetical protein
VAIDHVHVDLDNNAVIIPPRLTTHTVVQGVPFHTGFHPDDTNTANSPMQAYTEALSDSDSDVMVHFMLHDQAVYYQANASILARLSLAKATLESFFMPRVHLDNSYFFDSHVKFASSDLYELFCEAMCLLHNKKKSRKLFLKQSPSVDEHFSEDIAGSESNDVITDLVLSSDLGEKRKAPVVWGPRLTTRDSRYAYNSRSQETIVNPHNRVGISDYNIHYITSIKSYNASWLNTNATQGKFN